MRQNTREDDWNLKRPFDFDMNENKVIKEMFDVKIMHLPDPLVE